MARKRRGITRKLLAVLRMGRPVNAVMVFLATVTGALIAGLRPWDAILPALSAALISMGAQAVNDYYDVEVDRKKGRRTPLVEGVLTRKEARLVWSAYFAVGIVLALLASPLHFIFAILAASLSYLYSIRVQRKKYVGNVVVSLLVALSIVYGGLGGQVDHTLLPAAIVFLVNWGREIYKDIVDGDADYPAKVSLYHLLTKEWAGFLGGYLVFLGVILSPFPYLLGIFGTHYVPFMAIASLVALYAVAKALRDDYARAEKIVKVAMGIALVAYLVGAMP